MIHLSRFVSADSVLPIRLYRFSSIDSVLLIYFCRFTYIDLLMLICFTQFTSADSHSYNAMLSTLCFHLCRGYITAFCNRYRIPFDFISRNSMRQTPGRRNSRRFPDAHTGRLDAAAIPAASPMLIQVGWMRMDACRIKLALIQRPVTIRFSISFVTKEPYGIS